MKLYLIIGLVVALIGSHGFMYRQGVVSCQNKAKAAEIKHKERENELLLNLEQAKKERKIVYRDRIKIIEGASDACLDVPIPPAIERLFNDGR